MATPLTDSINALTRYANETTGASDTTLSDAVETLVAGYGGGEKAVLLRTVVPSTDSKEAIINFDNTWFNDYKFFVVKCHICYTAPGGEWLYYLWNTKSYSGLYYPSPSKTTAHFDTFFVLENTGSTVVFPKNNDDAIRPQGAEYSILESGNYLCVKLYTNNYDEGVKFELYGIGKDTEQRYSVKDFIEKSNITGDIVYDEVNNRGVSLSFTNITSVKFTNVVNITSEYGTFSNCKILKRIDFPKLVSLANSQTTFSNCTSLKCVYFPVLKVGAKLMFSNCSNLLVGIFPKLQNTSYNMFASCTKFETLDIGATGNGYDSTIGDRVFNGSTLKRLILRPSDRRVLLSSTEDRDTSVAMQPNGAGVDIYIPKVLYDCLGDGSNLDYLALPNWATVNGYGTITWKQIEGSQYEDRDWWKSLLEE